MANYIPYLILVILCIPAILSPLLHYRSYSVLVIFLAFSGLVFLFEYVVFILLECYTYSPKVLAINYHDNVLGSLVSNLIAVPSAALLVVIYNLNVFWMIGAALFFTGLDLLFVQLEVYEHHWWRSPYTLLGILVFMVLAKWLFNSLLKGRRHFQSIVLTLYSGSMISTILLALAVLKIRLFEVGVFSDKYRDDLFISSLYAVLLAIVESVVIIKFSKALFIVGLVIGLSMLQGVLIYLDILEPLVPLVVYFLIYVVVISTTIWLVDAGYRALKNRPAFR